MRIKNIICATDFTAFSREAVRFSVGIARRFDALLSVFHAVYAPQDQIHASTEFEHSGKRDQAIARARNQIESMMGPYEVQWRAVVTSGEPVEQFLNAAEQQDADLMLTAIHDLSGLKRLFVGTVVERICRHLSRPLWVVRPSVRPQSKGASKNVSFDTPPQIQLHDIVVACADNPLSERIIHYAAHLAMAFKARLHLVHAIEAPLDTTLVEPTDAPYTQAQAHLQDQLHQRLQARIPQSLRSQCEHLVAPRPGIPREILPAYIAEHKADLVIVGAWRQGKMENLLIGSTTKAMLRTAKCDVLVLPFKQPEVKNVRTRRGRSNA